ncbi:MAG: pyridoxal phosphate-dependent aminotransferase [Planctomycetes bacterium]|nr:pyridoxal phosphate-dependent aminotransferase [Planctomycetota bacterium]
MHPHDHGEVLFPYMFWAHTEPARTRFPLTQSGMPAADPALFAGLPGIDLGHPTAEALPALEGALARRQGIPAERVLVTLGASGGMHVAALRWFRPGTRVVTDAPSYEPFRALPVHFGADTVVIERRLEDGWRLDVEAVERACAAARGPAHVFFANLHNPTGARTEERDLVRLAAAAARTGGNLIVCEVYMEYVPAAERVFAHQVAPNGVSIGSFTKAYGLGPLRLGWIALGEGLAKDARTVRDSTYLAHVDPPTITLRAGKIAMDRIAELAAPIVKNHAEVKPRFDRWLSTCAAIESTVPAHGIIAFPRVKGVADTRALAEHLVRAGLVDVVPGEHFGRAGHVRIGCGVPLAQLEEGLARFERGVAEFVTRGARGDAAGTRARGPA